MSHPARPERGVQDPYGAERHVQSAQGESPSGWSAVTAGVLAVLCGCGGLVFAVLGGLALWDEPQLEPGGVVVYLLLVATTAGLFIGAVLLLRRRPSGQLTVAGVAAVGLCGLGYVLIAGTDVATGSDPDGDGGAVVGQLEALVGTAATMLVLIMVLVMLPATGRWCIRDESYENW